MQNELVFTKGEDILTTSIIIAQSLKITHSDILRNIKNLIENIKNQSPHLCRDFKYPEIFKESTFKDNK